MSYSFPKHFIHTSLPHRSFHYKIQQNSWKQCKFLLSSSQRLYWLIAEIVKIQNWSQTPEELIPITEDQTDLQPSNRQSNQKHPAAETVIVCVWPQRMMLIGCGRCSNAAKWLSRFDILHPGGILPLSPSAGYISQWAELESTPPSFSSSPACDGSIWVFKSQYYWERLFITIFIANI